VLREAASHLACWASEKTLWYEPSGALGNPQNAPPKPKNASHERQSNTIVAMERSRKSHSECSGSERRSPRASTDSHRHQGRMWCSEDVAPPAARTWFIKAVLRRTSSRPCNLSTGGRCDRRIRRAEVRVSRSHIASSAARVRVPVAAGSVCRHRQRRSRHAVHSVTWRGQVQAL
jgi:hypothetical protein